MKKRLCRKRGIKLICVPHNVRPAKLQNYIAGRLRKIGVRVRNKTPIDLSPAYSKSKLHELQNLCAEKDGRLLSRHYAGENERVEVRCRNGHVWRPVTAQLRRGKWCRECFRAKTYKWNRWENVERALKAIVRRYGSLPSQNKLLQLGYSGLVSSIISLHGGMVHARERMGLPLLKKPTGYWTRENIRQELSPFIRRHGRIPKKEDLAASGRNDLIGAIRRAGGFNHLRKRIQRAL